MKASIERKYGDVKKYMDTLLSFIAQHDNLYNYKRKEKNEYVNQFLWSNHFDTKVPREWQQPLLDTSIPDLIDMVKHGKIFDHFPESLKTFIRQCNDLQLQDIETTHHEKLDIKLKMKYQLKQKKLHELERLGKLVMDVLRENPNISSILDLGCGKGYLTSFVGFHFPDIEIIGIDNSASQIQSFQKRKEKLQFRMRNIKRKDEEKEEKEEKQQEEETEGEDSENVKPVTTNQQNKVKSEHKKKKKKQKKKKSEAHFENVKLVIKNLTLTNLNELDEHLKDGKSCILALHACGDLSPYCLKIFRFSKKIHSIILVSCCYFKMSQEYGFPLSKYTRDHFGEEGYETQSLAIGCFAPKTWTVKNSIPQFKNRSFRFALESLMYDSGLRSSDSVFARFNGRKVPRTAKDFKSYVRWGFSKIMENYPDKASRFREFLGREKFDEEVTEYYRKFGPEREGNYLKRVAVFWCLRALFSPVVETIVVVDRVLFLIENGVEEVDVKRIFQGDVSPRNLVLVASKKGMEGV